MNNVDGKTGRVRFYNQIDTCRLFHSTGIQQVVANLHISMLYICTLSLSILNTSLI